MKSVLIFSGNNDRAIIAFCRYATENSIDFSIVANGEKDLIFSSIYKSKVISIREFNILSVEKVIFYAEKFRKESERDEIFILSSTEFLNRFLIRNKNILAQNNIYTGLCDLDTYELISDKYKFSEACKDFQIEVPREFDTFPHIYPYIIKPKAYLSGEGVIDKPVIINCNEELKDYWQGKRLEDYYIQEYVGGKSIYLLYHFSKDEGWDVFSQENLIQQYNGGSMILAKSSNYHLEGASEKFVKLFRSLNYRGLVMVEVKLLKNKFVMIEANPRLWGPSQLILDAGMNLFDSFAIDNGLLKKKKKRLYKKDIWYFWSGGMTVNQRDHLPIKYYNFKEEDFVRNYQKFLENEVFLKSDTMEIYFTQNE